MWWFMLITSLGRCFEHASVMEWKGEPVSMQFFSTITIAREHRKALFQDVQHASGAREATEDWEILADWYHWCASARADGTLDGLHPSTASMSFSLLHPREKAQPQQWLVVCQLLAQIGRAHV